jgi:sucrose phosphorylase
MGALLRRRSRDGVERGLFDEWQWSTIAPRIEKAAEALERRTKARPETTGLRFTQRDAVCIAYPDHVRGEGDLAPAARLARLFNAHLRGMYNRVHILPHFDCPFIHPDLPGPAGRADGGFEPMSFEMSPRYGRPEDLQAIEAGLMFDFVLNHLSARGPWFRSFLAGDDPKLADAFIELTQAEADRLDRSPIFRPRAHDPIVTFDSPSGPRRVWCTFSATQVDINVESPEVFCRLVEILAEDFVGRGARWIRLDAVGYLVKKLGVRPGEPSTSCFGIEETHAVIKALRVLLDDVAPDVVLVAEVNAGKSVIDTYYGDGDEAHLAYDFPAAPRSLWATYAQDAGPLLDWAGARAEEPDRIGLAFTASHDGIGVLPMADVHSASGGEPLRELLIEVERRGGAVNMKSKVVGGETVTVPYEACVTWTQAVLAPDERRAVLEDRLGPEQLETIVARVVASASAPLVGPHCVPADYLGAIAGLLDDDETHARTGHNRDKNRGLIDETWLNQALSKPADAHQRLVHRCFEGRRSLLELRRRFEAFSPHARCEVDVVSARGHGERPVFSVLRHPPVGSAAQPVLCLTNVTAAPCAVRIDAELLGSSWLTNIVNQTEFEAGPGRELTLPPHAVAWISARSRSHHDTRS